MARLTVRYPEARKGVVAVTSDQERLSCSHGGIIEPVRTSRGTLIFFQCVDSSVVHATSPSGMHSRREFALYFCFRAPTLSKVCKSQARACLAGFVLGPRSSGTARFLQRGQFARANGSRRPHHQLDSILLGQKRTDQQQAARPLRNVSRSRNLTLAGWVRG